MPPKEFLKTVLQTPSPSGFEEPVQRIVRDYMKPFADDIRTDVHGNVIAVKNPDAPVRVMFAGHCDQIGLIANYIDDKGFLYVLAIGGWDIQNLIGQRVKIWTLGGPVDGVIGKKPIHLLEDDEKKKVPKIHDLWVDFGAASKEEAEKVVQIGDPITVDLEYRELLNDSLPLPRRTTKRGCGS